MPITLFREAGALVGAGLASYSFVMLYAAIRKPTWLRHPLLKPRWWGYGPPADRFAAAAGAIIWLVIGAMLINAWAQLLPAEPLLYILAAGFVVVLVAGLHQLAASGSDKA